MKHYVVLFLLVAFPLSLQGQCQYAKKEFDYLLEQDVKVLEPQLLFQSEGEADSSIVPLKAMARLQNIDGNRALWISIRLPKAASEMLGSLYRDKTVNLVTENKESLPFRISNFRKLEEANEIIYEILLPFGEARIKSLSRSKVRDIEVPWSKGTTHYSISSADFFIDQLSCIL